MCLFMDYLVVKAFLNFLFSLRLCAASYFLITA